MSLKVAVLIPAAGTSKRFQDKQKKQFAELNGRAVFLRTIEQFADRQDVQQVIIAIPAEDEELFQVKYSAKLGFYGVKYIIGSAERYETVSKLLDEVDDNSVDLVALHDAVRPCVTQKEIDAVFAAAAETGAAILASPLVGTVKRVDSDKNIIETVDRNQFWQAQTPQVFWPDIIRRAHAQSSELNEDITDDAQLVESLGIPVRIVPGDPGNLKITCKTDLFIASAIIKARELAAKPKGPVGPWTGENGW